MKPKLISYFTLAIPFAILGARANTQNLPSAYEIVSVKVNGSHSQSMSIQNLPNGLHASNISLELLLINAFETQPELIDHLPDWASNLRFDIDAKFADEIPMSITKTQRKLYLRQILASRFDLHVHQDLRVLPVYDLIVTNPQLAARALIDADKANRAKVGADTGPSMQVSHGELTARAIRIDALLVTFQGELGRKIIDQTALTGRYDVHLRWLPEAEVGGSGPSDLVTLPKALQEQLGLKLVPSKAPVAVIVIDRVERPQNN